VVKTRVSGVPYEVELTGKKDTLNNLITDIDSMIAELERENFMLRARTERLENDLRIAEEHISRLMIDLHNERTKK
jgi:hypothetical protein